MNLLQTLKIMQPLRKLRDGPWSSETMEGYQPRLRIPKFYAGDGQL
jgi:hypothetical protein